MGFLRIPILTLILLSCCISVLGNPVNVLIEVDEKNDGINSTDILDLELLNYENLRSKSKISILSPTNTSENGGTIPFKISIAPDVQVPCFLPLSLTSKNKSDENSSVNHDQGKVKIASKIEDLNEKYLDDGQSYETSIEDSDEPDYYMDYDNDDIDDFDNDSFTSRNESDGQSIANYTFDVQGKDKIYANIEILKSKYPHHIDEFPTVTFDDEDSNDTSIEDSDDMDSDTFTDDYEDDYLISQNESGGNPTVHHMFQIQGEQKLIGKIGELKKKQPQLSDMFSEIILDDKESNETFTEDSNDLDSDTNTDDGYLISRNKSDEKLLLDHANYTDEKDKLSSKIENWKIKHPQHIYEVPNFIFDGEESPTKNPDDLDYDLGSDTNDTDDSFANDIEDDYLISRNESEEKSKVKPSYRNLGKDILNLKIEDLKKRYPQFVGVFPENWNDKKYIESLGYLDDNMDSDTDDIDDFDNDPLISRYESQQKSKTNQFTIGLDEKLDEFKKKNSHLADTIPDLSNLDDEANNGSPIEDPDDLDEDWMMDSDTDDLDDFDDDDLVSRYKFEEKSIINSTTLNEAINNLNAKLEDYKLKNPHLADTILDLNHLDDEKYNGPPIEDPDDTDFDIDSDTNDTDMFIYNFHDDDDDDDDDDYDDDDDEDDDDLAYNNESIGKLIVNYSFHVQANDKLASEIGNSNESKQDLVDVISGFTFDDDELDETSSKYPDSLDNGMDSDVNDTETTTNVYDDEYYSFNEVDKENGLDGDGDQKQIYFNGTSSNKHKYLASVAEDDVLSTVTNQMIEDVTAFLNLKYLSFTDCEFLKNVFERKENKENERHHFFLSRNYTDLTEELQDLVMDYFDMLSIIENKTLANGLMDDVANIAEDLCLAMIKDPFSTTVKTL